MRGKVLFTQEEMPFLEVKTDPHRSWANLFVEKETNTEYMRSHLWELSDKPKAGAFDAKDEFLPYFADVTEDLPSSCRDLTPKKYKNCQLMVEKHGCYYQFYHKPSKQVLRIAMNSHFYTPIS